MDVYLKKNYEAESRQVGNISCKPRFNLPHTKALMESMETSDSAQGQ